MGSRRTGEGAARVYAAAQAWVDRALRSDDSLFTPSQPIWSRRWLGHIRKRFLEQPEVKGDDFSDKLKGQLSGSRPEVYQLMAEALYVNHLIDGFMKPSNKAEQIENVLGWSSQQVTIPQDFRLALGSGLIHPGQGFYRLRPYEVGFIIEFVERLKQEPATERDSLLSDPWAFKEALCFQPSSALLQEYTGDWTYRMQREALLHLIFPDTFERIISTNHKRQIVDAFAPMVIESTEDIDRRLQQIREGLEAEYGTGVDLYGDPIHSIWNPTESRKAWDRFVDQARAFVDTGIVDSQENDYKIEIGEKLEEARRAVLAGANNWADLVKRGLIGNLIYSIQLAKLRDWVNASPDNALRSLQAIWTKDQVSVPDRIRTFIDLLPLSVVSGLGTRTTVTSQILMGLDVYLYPPFRITLFNDTYDYVGYQRPNKNADEAAIYEHALGFLDRFIEEAAERGVNLQHRLNAQSLVWMIAKDPSIVIDPPPLRTDPRDLTDLGAELLLPVAFLEEIETLLKEKGQVVFQGPPGTGKTYVAQKLAEHLAGSKDRVTLVQFHPSYAYEDFVQGYRPSLVEGQPGFELKDGPLLQAARRAKEDSGGDHFLVIDEINRGNLAKVFGELYFLLEYRNEVMRLQYQADREFSLPKNLYIIGTMNTADRSIALVDLALRRRFYFQEFHPDDEPIKDLLRNWLREKAPSMEWVADVIALVNEKLKDDRHVAIGPSYFMGTDEEGSAVVKDETSVRRIWKHSVLPYIEEHLFGNLDGMDEWDLDKLMQQVKAKTQASVGEEGSANTDALD